MSAENGRKCTELMKIHHCYETHFWSSVPLDEFNDSLNGKDMGRVRIRARHDLIQVLTCPTARV